MRVLILYHPDPIRPEMQSFGKFIEGCISTCGTKRIYFGLAEDADRYAVAHKKNPFTHVFAHLMAEEKLAKNFPGDIIRKSYTKNRGSLYIEVFQNIQRVEKSSQANAPDIFIETVITEFAKFLAKTPLEAAHDDLVRFRSFFDGYSHCNILTHIFGNTDEHVSGYAAHLKKNKVSVDDVNRDYAHDIIRYYDSRSDGIPRQQINHSEIILIEDSDKNLGEGKDKQGNERLGLVGDSRKIAAIRGQIRSIFNTQNRALILGETGSGKEKIAEAFRILLGGNNVPFVSETCSRASSDISFEKQKFFGHPQENVTGLVKQAENGILFLDEIQNLSDDTQNIFKRFWASQPPYEFTPLGATKPQKTNIRFLLFATNEDFAALVAAGDIQHDVPRRIDANRITVPPLRERRLDIPFLVKYFCAIDPKNHIKGFTPAAMIALMAWEWSDNVGGLHNVITALQAQQKEYIDVCDLPTEIIPSGVSSDSVSVATPTEKCLSDDDLIDDILIEQYQFKRSDAKDMVDGLRKYENEHKTHRGIGKIALHRGVSPSGIHDWKRTIRDKISKANFTQEHLRLLVEKFPNALHSDIEKWIIPQGAE